MSARILYEIVCDCTNCDGCDPHECSVDQFGTCGEAVADIGTAGQVRKRIARNGWSVNRPGGKDLCWHCAPKRKR